jgi:CO/xanthine dehydrogenase FAD-binding subunit
LARVEGNVIVDIRIGAASLRETPARLMTTEDVLRDKELIPMRIATACSVLASESKPIDDIRSTAKYRAHVAANLLEDFLQSLMVIK